MSLEEEIINYLRENPGASIREIAEALGLSYSIVRSILYKLRNSGVVSKSEKGFYILRERTRYISPKRGVTQTSINVISDNVEYLRSSINEIMKRIENLEMKYENIHKDLAYLSSVKDLISQLKDLTNRINSKVTILEKEIANLKKQIEALSKQALLAKRGLISREKDQKNPLQSMLMSRGIIEVEEAKRIVDLRTIHELVENDKAIIIGPYVVSKEYYNIFKRKFPIPLGEERRLSGIERKLLKVMLSEGLAYIHGGKEYRVIE